MAAQPGSLRQVRERELVLDCALSLMRRRAMELRELVSESVWLRLGQGTSRCVNHLTETLREGNAAGVLALARR